MYSKLWFVSDGIGPIAVHKHRQSAEENIEMYKDEADYDYYGIYGIFIDHLDDYPEEYELALANELLH